MDKETITERVREILGDVSAARFSDSLIEAGIGLALNDYSQAAPNIQAEEMTLKTTGRDQVLELAGVSGSGAGFQRVVELYHYGAGESIPPLKEETAKPVEAWYGYFTSGSPVVAVGGGKMPTAGDRFYVKYTVGHTIKGLAGAETTTVRVEHLNMIIIGGAGYAAQLRAAATLESYGAKGSDALNLAVFADNILKQFRALLERARTSDLANGLPAGGGGWRLDNWDRRR